MSAEVAVPVVVEATEAPTDAAPPAKESKRAKPAKTPTKKAGGKKATPSSHPKYSAMIAEALAALKDRNGSSRQAILKYVLSNFSVGSDQRAVNNHLKMSLRACIKNGKLKHSKGAGASGSFRLADKSKTEKVEKKATNKAPKQKDANSTKKSLSKVKKPKAVANKKTAAKAKSSKKVAKSPVKSKSQTKTQAKKDTKSPSKKAAQKTVKKTPAKKSTKGGNSKPSKTSTAASEAPSTASEATK